jgi:hypothetical protein
VAIHDEQGEALWVASRPLRREGAVVFAEVVSVREASADTLGLAAALAAGGEVVRVALPPGTSSGPNVLRLAKAFRTDPYDRGFVAVADVALDTLFAGLAAGAVGPAFEGTAAPLVLAATRTGRVLDAADRAVVGQALARAAPHLAALDLEPDDDAPPAGPGDAAVHESSLAVGRWHDEVLTRLEPVGDPALGIVAGASVGVRPHYMSVVRASGLGLWTGALAVMVACAVFAILVRSIARSLPR